MRVFWFHLGSARRRRTWPLALAALAAMAWPSAGRAGSSGRASHSNVRSAAFVLLSARSPERSNRYRAVAHPEVTARLTFRGQQRARAFAAHRRQNAELRNLAANLDAALVTAGSVELLQRAGHAKAVPGRPIPLSPVAALALLRLSSATHVSPGRALAMVVQLAAICQLNPVMTAPMAALLAMTALTGPRTPSRTAPAAEAPSAGAAEPAATLRRATAEAWRTNPGAPAAGEAAESVSPLRRPPGAFAESSSSGSARRTKEHPFGAEDFFQSGHRFKEASKPHEHLRGGQGKRASSHGKTHHRQASASGEPNSRASSAARSPEHPLAWAYARLGLEAGASYEEAVRAYRRGAMALHPDRASGNKARFIDMKAGFDAIKAAHNAAGTQTRAPSSEARASSSRAPASPAAHGHRATAARSSSSARATSTQVTHVQALPEAAEPTRTAAAN